MPEFQLPPVVQQSTVASVSEIPYGVQMTKAPDWWSNSKGEGVVVAVLDTGCDLNHADLRGRIIGGRNFTADYNGDPNNYSDNQGHGTHCCGTIAGIENQLGVVGIAPKSKLLIGKVLNKDGSGSYDGIVAGIRWAVDWRGPNGERARVISMSLGGPKGTETLHGAVKYAIAHDVAVVCAAGNEGDGLDTSSEYAYPGAYEEVIEVGAIDQNKRLARFSNTNEHLDVVAPGVDILSAIPGNRWSKMSGTSMATPHVSGVLALLISFYEAQGNVLTEPEVYEILLRHIELLDGDIRGVGKGLVVLQALDPIECIEYEVSVEKIKDQYFVSVGKLMNLEEAEMLANELTSRLNLVPNVQS